MKALPLLLIALLCVSCTTRPTAKFTDPTTGAVIELNLGGTVMAKASGVLASVKHNGTELKYSAIEEDSTEVPKELIRTAGVIAGGIILNKGESIREGTKQLSNTNATKQAINADNNATSLAKEGLKAGTDAQAIDKGAELLPR